MRRMAAPLTGISSMATKALLADLARAYEARAGQAVAIESVGGVDAAKRVQAGEAFDVVVLASDAIDKLIASGHARAGTRTDVVRSAVAIAVRAGVPQPDIGTAAALKAAVLAAKTVGVSTGPSGVELLRLFERWGIAEAIRSRIVQATPGVPVGALVARGDVELGFQQLSELIHLDGITIVGGMPPDAPIVTTFSAAICSASARADDVQALLQFLRSPDAAEAKRRQGMEPA
jgi:molybdate transport system substrate-binding protein